MNGYSRTNGDGPGLFSRWWAVLFVAVWVVFSACSPKPATHQDHPADKDQVPAATTYYTCPMHHQIREDAPGQCPICGMTLVPVDSTPMKSPADTLAMVRLSSRQQFLGAVHTDTAQMSSLAGEVVLTGTTLFNPKQRNVVSAWVNGYIEKMYARNPGEKIAAGQKLYDLYSPELLAGEKDYLLALQQKGLFKQAAVDFTATIQAMKQKLLRWGLSPNQIEGLSLAPPNGKVTIYSKTSGYLIEKMKEEGDAIKEGEAVLSLAENNTLWVQAQLYDRELPDLSAGAKIGVQIAGSYQRLSGHIVFDNPVNEGDSRVHLVNIAIPNPEGKIQPGMLAYVYLETSKNNPSIVIPRSAVLYGENNNYVWVKDSSGAFQRRAVVLGRDNNAMTEVLHGIKPGEAVVSSGAYLVNSEYILQHGSGANLSGMQMSDMKMSGRGQ